MRNDLTIIDIVEFLIAKGPGRTASELAKAIFGPGAVQQRVNQECNMLVQSGAVEFKGEGGPADPFTYWPKAEI